jgi:hypothetical protein
MGMALLNVRLDPEDVRRAKALRKAGVPISELVRDAIRTEYERRVASARRKKRASRVVAEILASLPDAPDVAERTFDTSDRRAVKRHIRAKLGRPA